MAFLPVSRSIIFCLKATEYGLVMSAPRAQLRNTDCCDNYPDTGGRNKV